MRRLVVDAQVFHTPAFHRGMGKYSVELLAALTKYVGQHKDWASIEIVMSSKMPLDQEVQDVLQTAIPSATITRLALKRDLVRSTRSIMRYNRTAIDAHIKSLLAVEPSLGIDYLVLSPMQGGICSTFPSDSRVRKSLICYDLIPFMFHEIYFRNPIAHIENLTKLTELLKADAFLCISKTVANDLSLYLGIAPARIHNIDGGPINHSGTIKPLPGVPRPFILMPTGNELRKNNPVGVLGFNEFNKKNGGKYSLVITSFFEPEQIQELSSLADNVVFTGNISGSELEYLFQECEALLFPSQYEGLGLPVLEAVQKDKPVACSNIAVFREMSKTAFSYFNPDYGTSIAKALTAAIGSSIDKPEYARIIAKYDWANTSKMAVKAIMDTTPAETTNKPKLAIFGANPESSSRFAKMNQLAHGELSRLANIDYFLEGDSQSKPMRASLLDFVGETIGISGSTAITVDAYQSIIYNLANDEFCTKTLFTALANPGVLILHDLHLETVWQSLQGSGLVDGPRVELERALQEQFADEGSTLLVSVIASQKAIAVFGERDRQTVLGLLKKIGLEKPVTILPMPATSLVYDDILPEKDGVVASFGATADIQKMALFADTAVPLRKVTMTRAGVEAVPGTEPVPITTDREYEDVLSRLDMTYCMDDGQLMGAYDGARYGAIPILAATPKDNDVASDMFVPVTGGEDFAAAVAALAGTRHAGASMAARRELAKEHTYEQYAASLYGLVVQDLEGDNE
ncbi:MAG TPA: glycosyltransferase [Patescibacteria group bacterium]|nr:glycosyltransferase [Patescibacteria group bacterium]